MVPTFALPPRPAALLTLVHYDEDYDRISAITGQPTRWVTPRGTA